MCNADMKSDAMEAWTTFTQAEREIYAAFTHAASEGDIPEMAKLWVELHLRLRFHYLEYEMSSFALTDKWVEQRQMWVEQVLQWAEQAMEMMQIPNYQLDKVRNYLTSIDGAEASRKARCVFALHQTTCKKSGSKL